MKIAVFLALVLWNTGSIMAETPALRLAVIGDADGKDFASLLTSELSSYPDISLIERDDLAKIGDELKLEQLAGTDAVALGKLIGADGLIFLSKGPAGLQVRLTAVGLGYALFDDQVGSPVDLTQEARALAHRVEGYAPKLKLSPAQVIPISVLNLRADYVTGDATAVERKLTLLLESRLASLPEYVVLERRHGSSLAFEHSLSANPKPLLQGAYVIDGTLSFPLQNQGSGDLIIHLRLRSPTNQQTPLEIHGPAHDLAGLVEQMTTEIRKATGLTATAPPWQPQKEAREYLEEGIWGWQHNADDAALEALDSAELLGETAPDLVAARIGLLRKRASQGMGLYDNSENPLPSGPPSLDQRTDDTLEAISEAARYSDENMESKLQLLDSRRDLEVRAGEIKGDLAMLASKLLFYLDEAASPRAEDLRRALRTVTGYDPLHGKLGAGFFAHPYLQRDVFADQWAGSLEEELAYYHLLYTTPNQFLPPWLAIGHGENFCHRFLRNPEKEKEAFAQFVLTLENDPAGKLSYLLIMSASPDEATADAAYKSYFDELWNRRDDLVQEKGLRSEWYDTQFLPDKLRQRHALDAIPLLRYYLTHVNTFRYWEHSLDIMWQPEGWSEADAAGIWTDYLGFKQRVEVDWKAHGRNYDALAAGLAKLEDPLLQKFPQLKSSIPFSPAPLVIRRFWFPGLSGDGPPARLRIPDCQVTDTGLCLLGCPYTQGARNQLYQVSLPDFKTDARAIPGANNPRSLQATPDAFYVEYYKVDDSRQYIGRFDRKDETWDERVVKMNFEDAGFFVVNGIIYLTLDSGGLARYDRDKDEITLLASSRRKPAQNQFDDRSRYMINSVFAGPGNQPCAMAGEVYYVQEKPGNWPPVFDCDVWSNSKTIQDKTLVWSQYGEVALLDPAQKEPQYLMTPAHPHYRKISPSNQKNGPEMAAWASQTYWDAPELEGLKSNGSRSCSIGMHNDDFFVLVSPMVAAETYELLVYSKKGGRSPRRIPLQFHLEDATRSLLDPIYNAKGGMAQEWTLDKIEHPGSPFFNLNLLPTNQGLCLVSFVGGFWFLSYEDIDNYLKANPEDQPGPSQATERSDSQNQVPAPGT
jgi:hypothetical protein